LGYLTVRLHTKTGPRRKAIFLWLRLPLAELLIRTEQTEKYAEAADLLVQAANSKYVLFKLDWLRYWIAAARLSHRLGRHKEAADFAQRVLVLEQAKEPRKRRNQRVGHERIDSERRGELLELSTTGMTSNVGSIRNRITAAHKTGDRLPKE
jgi:hypothetical protein